VALQKYLPEITEVPPLRLEAPRRKEFCDWFQEHQPDVVVGHEYQAMSWMRELGAKIPETHGFVCLNSLRAPEECASLDLQTAELGERAVELATAQLLHNEMGIPRQPSLTTIPALWVDGPTVRDTRIAHPQTVKARKPTRRKGSRQAVEEPRQRSPH
jgi:hypothetical protein